MKGPRLRSRLGSAGVYVTLGAFLLFTVGPLLWLVGLSLKTPLQAFANPPLILFRPTFDNYAKLFGEAGFPRFFANSLIVATGTTVVCLAIGTPAAYGLVRAQTRWKNPVLVWILLMRMAPAMTYVIPFFVVFSRSGLIDTKIGLVLSYLTFNLPLVIWLMRSFFLDVPVSLEEAAIIDGASVAQAFRRVVLPITVPGVASAGILTFIACWNEFIFALVLTRRHAVTAPIGIVNLVKYEGTEWGQMGAGGVVLIVPAVIIAFFVGRYLVQGLTRGAVKE